MLTSQIVEINARTEKVTADSTRLLQEREQAIAKAKESTVTSEQLVKALEVCVLRYTAGDFWNCHTLKINWGSVFSIHDKSHALISNRKRGTARGSK